MTRTNLRPTMPQLPAGGLLCARALVNRHRVAFMPMDASDVSKWFCAQLVGNAFETTLIANPDPGGGGV